MQSTRVELNVDNTVANQDDLSYAALIKARKLGFTGMADMFAAAYQNYDASMSPVVLDALKTIRTCERFIELNNIRYKDDIYYVIRRTDPDDIPPDEKGEVKRKILIFSREKEDESMDRAIEFLDTMRPRLRASIVLSIVEQYMVTSANEFYFTQRANRLLRYLCEHADVTEEGSIQSEIEYLVDLIWKTGR